MSSIQDRIAALSPEKRKLLELRLKQKQVNSIPPRKASDTLCLSPMQEGLWLAHQLQPDLPLYNESSLFKLTGKLDINALEKSINKIIDRHDILRTSFQVIEDKVTQVVVNELTMSLPAIELTEYSLSERELVLRTNLDRDPSFLELLQRVKATTLAAYQHQDLPFEELVKELNLERSPSINPLFQVMFVYQEAPLLSFDLPDLTISPLPIDNGIAKFDLTLYIEDTKEELISFLEYSSDLFQDDTITRMLANFQTFFWIGTPRSEIRFN